MTVAICGAHFSCNAWQKPLQMPHKHEWVIIVSTWVPSGLATIGCLGGTIAQSDQ